MHDETNAGAAGAGHQGAMTVPLELSKEPIRPMPKDREELFPRPYDQQPYNAQEIPRDMLSYGGLAVGLDFNPAIDYRVRQAKEVIANLIDLANDLRNDTTDQEVKRMCSLAITRAQEAQMWAVKALTWRSKPAAEPEQPK